MHAVDNYWKLILMLRLVLVFLVTLVFVSCSIKSKTDSEYLCSINDAEDIDIGDCLYQKKEYRLAIKYYTSALEEEQSEFGRYALLGDIGFLYFELGEYHRVPFYLEQALAIEDYDMNGWELLSVSYFRQGMCAKGKQAMLNYEKITNMFDADFLLEHPDAEDPGLEDIRKEEDNCSKGILSKEDFWQLDEPEAKM